METQPMKDSELGQYVCVPNGTCKRYPDTAINDGGVWVKGERSWWSAHAECVGEDFSAKQQPITIELEPYGADNADVWKSGRCLRMRCNYTRQTHDFSVVYMGPKAEDRPSSGGLVAYPDAIDLHPMAAPKVADVQAGDVLTCNGQHMRIVDPDKTDRYPRLEPVD